jgi:hypothetical protein
VDVPESAYADMESQFVASFVLVDFSYIRKQQQMLLRT